MLPLIMRSRIFLKGDKLISRTDSNEKVKTPYFVEPFCETCKWLPVLWVILLDWMLDMKLGVLSKSVKTAHA